MQVGVRLLDSDEKPRGRQAGQSHTAFQQCIHEEGIAAPIGDAAEDQAANGQAPQKHRENRADSQNRCSEDEGETPRPHDLVNQSRRARKEETCENYGPGVPCQKRQ